jgi:hypothetical protein
LEPAFTSQQSFLILNHSYHDKQDDHSAVQKCNSTPVSTDCSSIAHLLGLLPYHCASSNPSRAIMDLDIEMDDAAEGLHDPLVADVPGGDDILVRRQR